MEGTSAEPEKLPPSQATLLAWEVREHIITHDSSEEGSAQREHHRVARDVAFAKLYDETYSYLNGTLHSMFSDIFPEDESIILGDTYLRVFKGLKKFRGDADARTWMTSIMINATSSYLTAKAKRRIREVKAIRAQAAKDGAVEWDDEDMPRQLWTPQHEEPSTVVVQYESDADIKDRILAALKELPEDSYLAFMGRIVHEHSLREVGKSLNVSEGAAKMMVFRARAVVREILGHTHNKSKEKA